MNEISIHKIKELNEKIAMLEDKGFDMEKEKTSINELCNIQTTFGNLATLKISQIEDISEIEKSIIYKYNIVKIFFDLDTLQQHINYNISKEKLDMIDTTIIGHLALYIENRDKFRSNKEDILIEQLYNFIKFEYRMYFSSLVFDKLLALNFGIDTLIKLIKKDIDKYINEKDIYKRFNEYFNPEQIDKLMVYLISLNEDDYKKKIIDELEKCKLSYKALCYEYEDKKRSHNNYSYDSIYTPKYGLEKAKKVFLNGIMPRLLSLAAIIGANYYNLSNNIEKYYLTTYKNYNNIQGESYTEEYTSTPIDNVIIKVYSKTDEEKSKKVFDVLENKETTMNHPKVTRTLYTYEVEKDGRNIEDYLDIDLSSLLPISTIEKAYDEDINYLSKEEFKTISVLDNVNLHDYEIDVGGKVFNGIFISILLILLDMFISYQVMKHNYKSNNVTNWEYESGITGPIFLDNNHSALRAFKEDLNSIKLSIENYEESLKQKKINKQELKELRKKIDIAKVEYQELLNRYSKLSDLLEYNGYTKKLN